MVKSTDYSSPDKEASSRYAGFTNAYTPNPTSAEFEVEKKLAGDKPSKDETFIFSMKVISLVEGGSYLKSDSDEEIKTGDSWSIAITGAGSAVFDEIEYCKAGKYVYEITELDGKADGWVYSKVKWTVTVTVTDEDGILSNTVTYESEGVSSAKKATFTNEYKPPETPKTGDDTSITRYLFMMAISLFCMAGTFVAERKYSKKSKR